MFLFNKKPIKTHDKYTANATGSHKYSKKLLKGQEFKDWIQSSKLAGPLPGNFLNDKGLYFKNVLEAFSRYVPTVSAAIWTWKHLCNTKQTVKFKNGTDSSRETSKNIIDTLDSKISPLKSVKKGGMNFLIDQFFTYIFTYGRFSGNLLISPNLDSIQGFQIIDPFSIRFDKDTLKPYQNVSSSSKMLELNPNTFYYFGLDMTVQNPYGKSMLEAAKTLIDIADAMLEDMRLSSSNAGIPRLHIKITQPEKEDNEDDEKYRERINNYFIATVDNMSDIGPEDNFYSWDNIEIASVGGTATSGYVFRANRSVIEEEIIAAFHLFPWILGYSASTTKNWVRTQWDLLMAQVESLQTEAKRFSEWIREIELLLHGITDVKPSHTFSIMRDPSQKDIAIAENFRIENLSRQVLNGWITNNDAARQMGYNKAVSPELIFKANDHKKLPTSESDDNIINEKISFLEDKIDQILNHLQR